jgi:hypothetical protein
LRFYDFDGRRITPVEWGLMFSRPRRVAYLDRDGVEVSTVWLGLDHGFGYTDRPLIFETMIFGGDYDEEQWRYATLDEALEGHQRACVLAFGVRAGSGEGNDVNEGGD